ncbi:MAG: DUF2330 domain-containing protein [Myxococcota bacterium]
MLSAPSPAAACGGTFCDGNNGTPVDQTGETIVFAQGGGFVEAHVQINYEGGDANDFSWIVPVPAVPEIDVGSLAFIESLRSATVPSYGIVTGTSECPSGSGIGFLSEPDGGGTSIDPDPEVIELSTVGAFDFVVLQGGTAATMMQWLDDNGYAPNPIAPELFDQYIDEGHVFVAFKLNHLAGIEDLHPVVIRYPGSEPCIPLRLTAVAVEDNMDIRAFFLGESRVMPTNYKHVRINSTRLDWQQRAPEYGEVVAKALDEAGGRAFMTEFAGSTDVVDTAPIDSTGLDDAAFLDIDPLTAVNVLVDQGLAFCTDSCVYGHELVPLLLREFLPPPADVDADTYYACLSCYEELGDTSAWDGAAFAERYREFITEPMNHADDLLITWPYLTRLYSRMSGPEMKVDPMFAEVDGLPNIPNVLGAQRNTDACCEDTVILPDGASVRLMGGSWPTWTDDMPYAAVIQQYQPAGPPAVETDNLDAINALLAAHNQDVAEALDCAEGSTGGDTGEPGTSGGAVDPTTTGGATPPPPGGTSTGPASGGSTSGADPGQLDDDGACRVGSDAPAGWMAMVFGMLLGARRRRR